MAVISGGGSSPVSPARGPGLFSRLRSPEFLLGVARGASRGLKSGMDLAETGSPLLSSGAGLFGGLEAGIETQQEQRQRRFQEQLQAPFGEAFPTLAKDFTKSTGLDISEVPSMFAPQVAQLIRAFRAYKTPDISGLDVRALGLLQKSLDDQLSGVGRFFIPEEQLSRLETLSEQVRVRLAERGGVSKTGASSPKQPSKGRSATGVANKFGFSNAP